MNLHVLKSIQSWKPIGLVSTWSLVANNSFTLEKKSLSVGMFYECPLSQTDGIIKIFYTFQFSFACPIVILDTEEMMLKSLAAINILFLSYLLHLCFNTF